MSSSGRHLPEIAGRVRQLLQHLPPRRRRQFVGLVVLMVISALVEVVNIGALLPFLAVLASPEVAFEQPVVRAVAGGLGITSAGDLILPMTALFLIIAVAAGTVRILLLRVVTRFIFASGHDLSVEMYRRTLFQPYGVHVMRNTSEVISALTVKTNSIMFDILLPTALIINAAVLISCLTATLLIVDFVIALGAALAFVVAYLVIVGFAHQRLRANGKIIANSQTTAIKLLQEGLGGIRDVLLDGMQRAYVADYEKVDRALREAQGNNLFYGQSPRYIIEAGGIAAIALLALAVSQQGGLAAALPTLGALALGVQRLLPAFQQGYNSWSLITGNQVALDDALALLNQPLPDRMPDRATPLRFEEAITFENISFRYVGAARPALTIVELRVRKGARIGIVGATGSGKSTFLDIFMGLLIPESGAMSVDGVRIDAENSAAWQSQIAHVPQAIYLVDGSIAANIALGVRPDEIDRVRLEAAVRDAQLADFVESLPRGLDSDVGERGVRLSGGQRQRIGIARALYKRAAVLVLDEATSALDSDTENAVMKSVETASKDLTILVVAHRLSTLANCDEILSVKDGTIIRRPPDQLV